MTVIEKKAWGRSVRQPRIDKDFVANRSASVLWHGTQVPVRSVIHSTESGDTVNSFTEADGVVNYWKNQAEHDGAHLLIDAEGNTAFIAPFSQSTYAVCSHNTGSVHIELVGRAAFTTAWWLSPSRVLQLTRCARWLAYLNLAEGIPLSHTVDKGVAMHRDFTNYYHLTGNCAHYDPGSAFPFDKLLSMARWYRKYGWL